MGYAKVGDACYLVVWDADNIVKAGYSDCQRWRKFMLRGARLAHLEFFPSSTLAFNLEFKMDAWLGTLGPFAFTSAADARKHLGIDGGGWAECYRVPDLAYAVASCIGIATAYAEEHATPVLPLHARTDVRNGRTYGDAVESQGNPATNASRTRAATQSTIHATLDRATGTP